MRFFRTPKGLLIIVLSVLAAAAAPVEGVDRVWPGLAAGSAVAMLVDAPILKLRTDKWQFPSGALLTGMIAAMVLSPLEPWYVAAETRCALLSVRENHAS